MQQEIDTDQQCYDSIVDDMNSNILTSNTGVNDVNEIYQHILDEIDERINTNKEKFDSIKKTSKLEVGIGPCASSLDDLLKSFGVERQAYHGKSLIGNHAHIMLKPKNTKILCSGVSDIVHGKVGDSNIYITAQQDCLKYEKLFNLFNACHILYDSARELSDDDTESLEFAITSFMQYLRLNYPEASISPKLHLLEDHVVTFVKKWHCGLGFYGEQGRENIHHDFKRIKQRYNNIKDPVDRLSYTMNQHLVSTKPQAQLLRPVIKKRKIKSTVSNI